MLRGRDASKVAIGLALAASGWAANSVMVVDRGLPQANLNNVSGVARSNVRWASGDSAFVGDTFAVGVPGERWVIDEIRTWTVPGLKEEDPNHLGDFYQDVRLYFGTAGADITPAVSAALSAGSDETGNANVRITNATAAGTPLYDDFGRFIRVWQVDFTNLSLPVEGGAQYSFGVWGQGRPIAPGSEKNYMWFNHASNAALSSATEDLADGVMLMFDGTGRAAGEFNAQGHGWDKSSDINVQVFAHKVSESASVAH
ncbi:MAG: hypothetical protein JO323_14185 [Acidobacteriia bacterium]|nr:hypothetical protein [Terriglobia bacterium]